MQNLASKILCIFVTGSAYAPYAPCLSTPLNQTYIQEETRLPFLSCPLLPRPYLEVGPLNPARGYGGAL